MSWDISRGFGIVAAKSPHTTALLHFRDILSDHSGSLAVGTHVEFDLEISNGRERAIKAVELKLN
jgi:cold shock CspA family protein